MSDPAVEAAQRAWLSRGVPTKFAIADLADAAREALKPIREWLVQHKDDLAIPRLEVAIEDLLPLIYATEELQAQEDKQ